MLHCGGGDCAKQENCGPEEKFIGARNTHGCDILGISEQVRISSNVLMAEEPAAVFVSNSFKDKAKRRVGDLCHTSQRPGSQVPQRARDATAISEGHIHESTDSGSHSRWL